MPTCKADLESRNNGPTHAVFEISFTGAEKSQLREIFQHRKSRNPKLAGIDFPKFVDGLLEDFLSWDLPDKIDQLWREATEECPTIICRCSSTQAQVDYTSGAGMTTQAIRDLGKLALLFKTSKHELLGRMLSKYIQDKVPRNTGG